MQRNQTVGELVKGWSNHSSEWGGSLKANGLEIIISLDLGKRSNQLNENQSKPKVEVKLTPILPSSSRTKTIVPRA